MLRRPHTRDYRTRRDRTQRRVQAFNVQLPVLVEAYMEWMLQLGEDGYSREYMLPPNAEVQATINICEVDVYREPMYFSLFFYSSFFLSQVYTM
jgi:hypothetical protein